MGSVDRLRRWDPQTERLIVRAGWRPGRDLGRKLRLPNEFELFPAAEPVVWEFGGLSFREPSGYTTLDPCFGLEIAGDIHTYQKKLGRRLYPLGIIDGGDTLYLVIDDAGIVYTITCRLEPFASSFDQAIVYLSRVCAVNQKVARDDLEAIGLFGKWWELEGG